MSCGYVGTLTVDLHLPEARSLKDKRGHVRRLKASLTKRFTCAVAEVDHHDLHRRTRLTLAIVCREAGECDRLIDAASRWVEDDPHFTVIDASRELIAIEPAALFRAEV